MNKPVLLIFFSILVLVALGVVFVYDASVAEAFNQFNDKYYFARQQVMWAAIGLSAMAVTSFLPIGLYRTLGFILFFAGLLALVAVLIPGIGTEVQGAQRWIVFGPARFQPAELMKLGIVLYYAHWLLGKAKPLPFFVMTGVVFGLLLLQPDLGSALVLLAIAMGTYVGAGGSWKSVGVMSGLGVVGILLLILISPYRMQRIIAFQNPETDPLGASYHIRQITIALGSGGWFGQGIGQSRQKYQYIPEASTDSIFAIAAEEVGFLGSMGIILFYLILVWSGYRIAERAVDPYARLVALGISTWIASQAILNLGSIVALVPLTGVPLPFLSYGGSALLTMLAASGILIGIGRSQT